MSNMTMQDMNEYQEWLDNKAKKKAKKAKKKLKKANKKLKELAAVADMPKQETVPEMVEPPVVSYTKTGRPSMYTPEEREQFQKRIDNEKSNIVRQCSLNAERILQFCEENKMDEKNPAVRYAREAAVKWASTQVKRPF